MRADVLSFCRENALLSPGDRVICAVSGGGDSMALLHCLWSLQEELKISVNAAHFNHRLRGAASDGDEIFVKEFCQTHDIPFFSAGADVKAHSEESGKSLEEAARELRYEFLRSLPGNKIATGHNADDNAETVLLHLLRGSGLRGLCGIPVKNGTLIRPLLSQTRQDILSYLQAEGLSHREDASNAEDFCLRNRLRHRVIPLLQEEAPQLSRRMLTRSALLREEDEFLDAEAAKLLVEKDNGYAIAPILAAPLPLRRRALRLILQRYLPQNVSLRHVEALLALLSNPIPSAQLSLPGDLIARRCYDAVELSLEEPAPLSPVPVTLPGVTELPALGLRLECLPGTGLKKNENSPFHFSLNCDMMWGSSLILRPRQTGDSLVLPNGHRRSLKKLLIDRKIPLAQRDRLAVLVQGNRVLAIPGIEISRDALAQPGQPALIIRLLPEARG